MNQLKKNSQETKVQDQILQVDFTDFTEFTGRFFKTFKEELTLILLKLLQNTEEIGMPLNSFYKACITLIAKPDIPQKKLQANITHEHRCKIFNKTRANQIQQ